MNNGTTRQIFLLLRSKKYLIVITGLCALSSALLPGCGDERTNYQPLASSRHAVANYPSNVHVSISNAESPNTPDPLASNRGTMTPPADPLLAKDSLTQERDPLLQGKGINGASLDKSDDRLSKVRDPLSTGPVMPTDHSHWLHGSIFNAKVTVILNDVLLGTYMSPVDKDITMKCRKGFNTIAFTYEPSADSSSASLDVLESEHSPPIPPLATFAVSPTDTAMATSLAPPSSNLPDDNSSSSDSTNDDSSSSGSMMASSSLSHSVTKTFSFIAK